MANVDKDIEKLIVRGLDSELSEDEQLALDRELIRNPEARRLMDEYRRIDEVTAAVLHDALGGNRMPLDPDTLPSRAGSPPIRRYHRGWWLVPGAVAAALLAVVVGLRPPQVRFPVTAPFSSPVPYVRGPGSVQTPPIITSRSGPREFMRTVGNHPMPRVKRSTGRDVFGVMGEDGNIYWIEVDRVWTLRQARPGSVAGVRQEEL
jgi:hypothetical protein